MKVLMFGWEFPPFNSGGLGTACYGITKALARRGVSIDFVLPKNFEVEEGFMKVISAELPQTNITLVDSLLTSYMTNESYLEAFAHEGRKPAYRANLVEEVMRYSAVAKDIANDYRYDIIHCHDWMTLLAGEEARKISGKPLVSHIHSTEADRSGGHASNTDIFRIEKRGIKNSDRVIAVSRFTRRRIMRSYGVRKDNIDVIYNGVDREDFNDDRIASNPFGKKIVLFLGRLTLHKGPDYFLRAAKMVLDRKKDVIFVISGSGDMEKKMILDACRLGISDNVLFTGFIKDERLKKIYHMANLYVMPSVSEPFGITPLEALSCGTPVLISKQSGVSEVLNHCLKADFWDVEDMADKIISVLDHQELEDCLARNGGHELGKLNWDDAAARIIDTYNNVLGKRICLNS